MTHDEVLDLLEDYVDETLDRATRSAVDEHLADCAECRSILEGVPAVALSRMNRPAVDDKGMRRIVRRSMLRIAGNTFMLALVGWLVLALVSALFIQPALVNRGGRSAAVTLATRDLAVMLNPGASVEQLTYSSGFFDRTISAGLVFPVGTEIRSGGNLQTVVGLTTVTTKDGFPVRSVLGGGDGHAFERLSAAGSGTVATIELTFADPISIERATELADSALDVRVVWAGFALDERDFTGVGFQGGGSIGYSTCDENSTDPSFYAGTDGSAGGSVFNLEPSIVRALEQVQGAVANMIAHPSTANLVGASEDRLVEVYASLATQPSVSTLVVTGPSPDLLEFLAVARPSSASTVAIEFTNWFQPICGR